MSQEHNLLIEGKHSTQKDLYYTDVPQFKTYRRLLKMVNYSARSVQVPRDKLNIVASHRSRVFGNLAFYENGNYIDCMESGIEGTSIHPIIECITQIRTSAKFILIVEDDSTFQRLIRDQFVPENGPCIILTSRGYPDFASRQLVKHLSERHGLKAYGLFDYDPFGIEILCTYAFGSKESDYMNEKLRCPDIEWIGVLNSDVDEFKIPFGECRPASDSDIRRCERLYKLVEDKGKLNWSTEILPLIRDRRKFEIQSLMTISIDFLSKVYLPQKLKKSKMNQSI